MYNSEDNDDQYHRLICVLMLLKEQFVFKFLVIMLTHLKAKLTKNSSLALAGEAIKSLYRNYRKISLKK